MQKDALRCGDLVEVRSAAEILATLDERGMLDGLPFMPEMIRYCGRRLIVDTHADKVCDTVQPVASRRLPDTVLLGALRCDGAGHDGCQAECRVFWKQAWLRRVEATTPPPVLEDNNQARDDLEQLAAQNTKVVREVNGRPKPRYQCQATELHRSTVPLHVLDPRAYLRVYAAGDVSLGRFVRVIARAAIEEPRRMLDLSRRLRRTRAAGVLRMLARPLIEAIRRRRRVSAQRLTNRGEGPGQAALNLQPGDVVQVKSKKEILATLGPDGKTRGLWFDREMLPYCGGTYQVKQRVTQFIDERAGGQMVHLKSDCIHLEGVWCSGDLSPMRWLCPREIRPFWREAWLRRVEVQPNTISEASRDLALDAVPTGPDHHAGWAQLDPVELE